MAHMMEGTDTMFSARGIEPWHYLEYPDQVKLIQEAPTSKDALQSASLGWDVQSTPVLVNDAEVEGYRANVRSDTGKVLGIVSDRYKIVQNQDAFDFTDGIIGGDVKYETAGSLEGGKRVYLLARMPDFDILGDDMKSYLFFTNSHSGKSGIMSGLTTVRVVCNNTLQLAIQNCPRLWKTKHMGDMSLKTREAQETLAMARHYIMGSKQEAEEMAQKKISESTLMRLLDTLFPVEEDATDRIKKNVAVLRDGVMTLYKTKPDLANFQGTAWGIYNAVADMLSNTAPLRLTSTFREKKMAAFIDGEALLEATQKLLQTV